MPERFLQGDNTVKKHIDFDGQQVQIQLVDFMFDQDAEELKADLLTFFQEGYRSFVFDFEQLEYIDSTGLAVLIALYKKVNAEGGRVIVKGLKGPVKELFEITRLTRIFGQGS